MGARGEARWIKSEIDPRAIFGKSLELGGHGDQITVCCPLHDDTNPSLSLDLARGLYQCKSPACRAANGGDVIDFWRLQYDVGFSTACQQIREEFASATRPPVSRRHRSTGERSDDPGREIPSDIVDRYHDQLLSEAHSEALQALVDRRGWTTETVRQWRIGLKGTRYTIPVFDADRRCRNLRLYRPDPPEGESKFLSYGKGYGQNRLFNEAALAHEAVLLVEGEPDVITLSQYGFDNALTTTLGAGNWSRAFNEGFRGKDVVVIYDIDDAGKDGARKVAAELTGIARSTAVIDLPLALTDHPHGDVSDFLREHDAGALHDLVSAAAPRRGEITISTDMAEVVDQAESELLALDVGIYRRTGRLVRVRDRSHRRDHGVRREDDIAIVESAPAPWLRESMSRAARWFKLKDGSRLESLPPPWTVDALMARGDWSFPRLRGIVHSPCPRPDGTLLTKAGYDEQTELYHCATTPCEAIPEKPTREQALAALAVLWEPFTDFPFAGDAENGSKTDAWAATVAALLTVICRYHIDGAMPMFLVTAPVRGSGKTRLVDTISLIANGHMATRAMPASNEDEERKRLVSLCLANDPLVLIDNIERPLKSAVLAAALTSRQVRDRILGASEMVTAPMDGVWFGTGNNVQVRGDLARRIVLIELDPGMEFPEEREGFQHPDLIQWVRQQRPALLAAALTILKAFLVADKQQADLTPFGSFEEWSNLVRACVKWITDVDPLGSRDRLRKDADLEYESIRAALETWVDELGAGSASARTLKGVADWLADNTDSPLRDALRELYDHKGDAAIDHKKLGYALRKPANRVVDGRQLRSGNPTKGGREWWVDQTAGPDQDDPAPF
jgi:5S rRNA maturation endonuclease (ribonuclease M5)